MVAICVDTSFLFSLYGLDANTPKAKTVIRAIGSRLTLSPFNEFEMTNAIRLSVFRGIITNEQASFMLADFAADKESGRLVPTTCNLAGVLTEATRLSASYTLTGGHRAFDILHLAVATVVKAKVFLTFDKNQRILAKAVGIHVKP